MGDQVTDEMIEAGQYMASILIDARIAKDMGGLGGSQTWEEWLGAEVQNKDIVVSYLNEEIGSETAIYLAMCRAKPTASG